MSKLTEFADTIHDITEGFLYTLTDLILYQILFGLQVSTSDYNSKKVYQAAC